MRLAVKALRQCRGDARLADAGFAGDQHDLAVARLGARPAPQQQVDLLVAADQRGQRRSAQGLEPARDDARTQHLPGRHRRGEALDLDGAEIAVLEEIADQPARAGGDDDRIRLGQGLQTGGEVRRLADDRLLLRRAFADQIADHHQPGGDADPRLQLDGFDVEAADSIDQSQPRPDSPLGIVLMRPRVAEIDQHAVAHIFGDKAIEPGDDFCDGAVIRGDDFAQILGIEPRGESVEPTRSQNMTVSCRRSAATVPCGLVGRSRWPGPSSPRNVGDGREQLAPMSDEADAEVLEIVGGQLGQYRGVDGVVAKRLLVLLQPETVEPRCDVHARLPAAPIHLSRNCSAR